MRETWNCSIFRTAGVAAAVLCLGLLAAPVALAQVDIHSSGPLTDIWIDEDLNCQVAHTGESDFQFFDPTDTTGSCGTMLSADGQINGFQGVEWIPVNQSGVTGAGTSQSPYQITTVVQAQDGDSNSINLTVTEVDSYVVGNEYYRTDMTVSNTDPSTTFTDLKLYHAGDCYLQGSDAGFGFINPSNGSVACTQTANNSPAGLIEEFAPLTGGNHFMESNFSSVFDVPTRQVDFPDTCDCNGDPNDPGQPEDNGEGVNWDIASLGPGQSQTFSMLSSFSASGVTTFPISATGGQALAGSAGSPLSASVATFTDPNSGDPASAFSATINWGDGSTSTGTVSGGSGSFGVAGSHTYAAGGSYVVTVTISQAGGGGATVTDTANITAIPVVAASAPPTVSATGAGLTGSVNPGGLPTTASFQYGLDPKYTTGGGPVVYTSSTPSQLVGADFTSHAFSATLTGLVPNAVYHARLVASNSAGTTLGPDVTFKTKAAPPPGQPTVGQTFNIAPVSGIVLVEINGKFIPLTELRQIPQNAVVNALHGTLQLITASGGGSGPAHDAAAKKGKKPKKVKTQTGQFGGAVFRLHQVRGGLATLTLVEGLVKGGPSFAECNAKGKGNGKAGDVTAIAASSKTLQLLHGSAKGKFSTKGKYAAATVRGTKWTVADRCDGTLTHDITHSVAVTDFVLHKTIILHAGQSYLAKPRKRK